MLKMPLEGQGKISTYFFKGNNANARNDYICYKIKSATFHLSVIFAFLCSLFENIDFACREFNDCGEMDSR